MRRMYSKNQLIDLIEEHGGTVDINIENDLGQDSIKQKMTDTEEVANMATGRFASAFGHGNKSLAKGTFLAGGDNEASADHSVAIGFRNRATKGNALALGCRTTATGDSAVAQGYSQNQCPEEIEIRGEGYHYNVEIDDQTPLDVIQRAYQTDGPFTLAERYGSHAKGQNTVAFSQNSTAEGQGTFAYGDCQHAFGKFNVVDPSKSQLVRVTGWGESNNTRKNIEELDRDGTLDIMGMPKTEFSVLTARFMKQYPMLFNCVSFVPKNWTADQWDNVYGKLGYSDVAWSGTNHLTKEIEGTFFALYGTTFHHAGEGVSWYKKHIAILRSTGGNPSDPTDSRASGQVIIKYDYLKGSNGSIEPGKQDLFKILDLD